jgi:hypothetical protein
VAIVSRGYTQAVVVDHSFPEDQVLPVCISGVTAKIKWRTTKMRELLVIQSLKLLGICNFNIVGDFLNPVI